MVAGPLTLTYPQVLDLIDALDERRLVEHAQGGTRDLAARGDLDNLLATLRQLRAALHAAGPEKAVATVTVQRLKPQGAGEVVE